MLFLIGWNIKEANKIYLLKSFFIWFFVCNKRFYKLIIRLLLFKIFVVKLFLVITKRIHIEILLAWMFLLHFRWCWLILEDSNFKSFFKYLIENWSITFHTAEFLKLFTVLLWIKIYQGWILYLVRWLFGKRLLWSNPFNRDTFLFNCYV